MRAVMVLGVIVGTVGVMGCAATHTSDAGAKPAANLDSRVQSQPGAKRDPQAGYEPRSEPGEGQKYLSRMEGSWTVVKTFYPRSGDPAVTKGTCEQKMIQGGRFLESDFVFQDAAGPTTGMGVIGFDAQTGKFTSFWVDSRSTRFSVRQSEAGFDGKQILLWSQNVGEPGPNARRSRTVSVLEDGDKRLVHRQYTAGADGKQRIVMQLEMTRK